MKKTDLLGMTIEEIKEFAAGLGEKPFRGKQVYSWIAKGAQDFCEMTNLPLAFRERLEDKACIGTMSIGEVQRASDGTRKYLFILDDENAVEGVFMKYSYGNSMCISSQVGCRMGCSFCASGIDGLVRNLTAGEMICQIMMAERETGERINHIVVMGTGEPFDNYDELAKFLRIIHDPAGRNFSYRSITVSTSGLVPYIERFGDEFPQVNLAISLHRLTDEGRTALMPVNKAYPLDELLRAAKAHAGKTGRRVTFEYALIKGENDGEEDVNLLCKKLKGMLCHVNLIPLNPVNETGFDGNTRRRAEEIAAELENRGIPCTVRRELGREIDGACGQLRLKRGAQNG